MTSLANIDAQLSRARRAYESAAAAHKAAFDAVDAVASEIDALEAAGNEGADLEGKYAELKTARASVFALQEAADKAASEVRDVEALRASHQLALQRDAALKQPVVDAQPAISNAASADVRVKPLTSEQQDHDLVGWFRGMYLSSVDRVSLKTIFAGHDQYANYRNDRLLATIGVSGNPSLIPTNTASRLIELLRAKTVVRRLPGLRQIPLPNGNLTLPRQSGAGSAAYNGEFTNIAESNPTTDNIALSAKKLTALVVQSGELLRRSNPSSELMVRDDIVQVVARAEDAQFLRGAGSSTAPKGLKAYADASSSTQVITANATVNLANVTTDLQKLQLALVNANTPMVSPCWIMAPRSSLYLRYLRDSNGNFAFPEMASGMLMGMPFFDTTQIPVNLGAGTDASEVYLVDASEFIVADTDTFLLSVSDTAAWYNGSAVQAAFSQDAVVFRLIVEHDTQIRHPLSCAYLSAVKWGA